MESLMKKELQILFHSLYNGFRQEIHQRSLASLVTGRDFSLTNEREAGVASCIALHLRSVGFIVQVESYFVPGPTSQSAQPSSWLPGSLRRPDFRIWLPASRDYIYIELKIVALGGYPYSFTGAIKDIKKLHDDPDPQNQRNGLIALGLSRKIEKRQGQLWNGFRKLSSDITNNYPYEEIGLERIFVQEMDERTSYAALGLWFHKPS